MPQPTVFIGVTVAPKLDYCWDEVLASLAAIDYPAELLHAHLVSHCAVQAKLDWMKWGATVPFRTSSEMFDRKPSAARTEKGGYDIPVLETIMHVEQQLRKAFLVSGCDYMLCVECDQLVSPDIVNVLLATQRPIVMASTPARHDPAKMNCAFGKLHNYFLRPLTEFPKTGVVDCISCGVGCTLIRRDMMEQVGWDDPARLAATYHNGGDLCWCVEATSKTGEVPCVCMDTSAVHVNNRGGTLLYYSICKKAD